MWGAAIGELRDCQPAVPKVNVADNMLRGKMYALQMLGDSIGADQWHYE